MKVVWKAASAMASASNPSRLWASSILVKKTGSKITAIRPVARLNSMWASAVRRAETLPPIAASAPVTVVPMAAPMMSAAGCSKLTA